MVIIADEQARLWDTLYVYIYIYTVCISLFTFKIKTNFGSHCFKVLPYSSRKLCRRSFDQKTARDGIKASVVRLPGTLGTFPGHGRLNSDFNFTLKTGVNSRGPGVRSPGKDA